MNFKEVIIILTIFIILSLAIASIFKMKKKGGKCIGCAQAGCCSNTKINIKNRLKGQKEW